MPSRGQLELLYPFPLPPFLLGRGSANLRGIARYFAILWGPKMITQAFCQKNPRALKTQNRHFTPPPQKKKNKTTNLWVWKFSSRNNQNISGAHKIGAAISGPRVAAEQFTDIRLWNVQVQFGPYRKGRKRVKKADFQEAPQAPHLLHPLLPSNLSPFVLLPFIISDWMMVSLCLSLCFQLPLSLSLSLCLPVCCFSVSAPALVALYCAMPQDYLSYTPLLRAMGFFGVSTWPIGCDTPALPFSLESMRSGGAIPPPPHKRGISATLA